MVNSEYQEFTVRLPKAMYEGLRTMSFEQRRPIAELVRTAIANFQADGGADDEQATNEDTAQLAAA